MALIKVIGLGPGSLESITIGTINILRNSSKIYLRTEKHPIARLTTGSI